MLGIAFIGGEGPNPETIKEIARDADLLVAADCGLIACEEAGLAPDWIVGDMDSVAGEAGPARPPRLEKYPPERVIRYPRDKDHTDTELAINLLREKGCGEIWLSGGGGGRTDHLFAVRSLFERENPPQRWFTHNEEIRCLGEGCSLRESRVRGSLVSVFPLGTGQWAAESSSLKWPLDGLTWERGSFGLSNEVMDSPFEIRSVRGRFMVIMPMIFYGE